MIFRHPLRIVSALSLVLGVACSSSSEEPAAGGGDPGGSESGGAGGGGATASSGDHLAGAASGGSKSSAGTSSSVESAHTGGASGTAGNAGTKRSTGEGGTLGAGGSKAIGGAMGTGGVGRADAGSPDGRATGSGGRASAGGTNGTGGNSALREDAGGKETGAGGQPGTFDPCPASGACKILPLGDSITWGVNYDGGYRVKLFADTITDKKSITYVGKLSNGPATVSGASFPKNNEGHSGWTIQQLDDIVTGKATDANYSGKKMIVDQAPNIVLLHAGTNDTSRSPSGMTDRLGALIDHIVEDGPNVLLVVTTIIPIKQGSYGTVGETFDNAIPDLVEKRIAAGKHVVLVDMFKNFPSGGLSSDGVHPNQQGYDWMAGIWYDAIKSYLH